MLRQSTFLLLSCFILAALGEVDQTNVRRIPDQDNSDLEADIRNLVDSRFAFPTVVSAYLPAPFITAGACNAGTKYNIQKVADLYNYLDQLECVFHAGLTPSVVGLGYTYGTLLLAANNAWPATVSEVAYQGDYIVKTWCKDAYYNIGVLNIAGLDVGTAKWYIGELPGEVTEGEHWDGKRSIIADFRINVKELCPVEGNESTFGLQGFVPFRNSIPPVNGYVDVSRVVGRDSRDGGLIYLNKAYATSAKTGYSTALYYATKNFDSRVNVVDEHGNERVFAGTPEGEAIVVTKDFTYSRKGVRAVIEGLPASLDIVNMQRKVAQRDAIDTILSNSLLGYRHGEAANVLTDVGRTSSAGIAQAVAGVAEYFPTGLAGQIPAAEIQESLRSAAENVADPVRIQENIKKIAENVGQVNVGSIRDRISDAGGALADELQGALSGALPAAVDRDL